MTLYTVCLTVVLYTSLLSSQTLAGKTTRRFVGLPDSGERITTARGAVTKTLIIRHDLPGRVLFHESNEFWIELQLTTPEGHNNSLVKTTYTSMSNDTILLQVYEPSLPLPVEASPQQNLLLIISVSVGSFVFLCLVVSALCYFCYWKKRRVLNNKKGGDPQGEERIPEARTMSSKRRFYEAGSGGGPSSGTLTVAMVLAVCACVLQAQVPSASVEITVFFPRGFLRRDSKVFLNSENNNEFGVITNDTSLKINVFDVKNASVIVENQCADKNLTCINGACDPLTGKCACPRKMKIEKRTGGETRCVFRCDDKCPAGFFESSSCNHTHLAVCKKCRPQCSFKEFESVACAGRMDRNCTDISKLPQINVSPNIVYEDLRMAKEDPTLKRTISNFSDTRTVWLNRSTGVGVQVRVLQVDFSSTFKEVEHSANDNSRLPTASLGSMRNYCNSPVPDYYRLGLQESSETVKIMKGNPSSPCPRYDGQTTVLQDDSVLFCNGAENTIVRLFGVKKKLESFSREEGSRRCYNLKQSCDGCREKCTVEARNNPTCNLTQADSDEGRQNYGEHFTYCFDCCFQVNCTCSSCACSQYESSCLNAQIPCVEVKQFTISIDPIFRKTGVFKCHVQLVRGPVFQLEATVWKDGKMLRRVDLTARNNSGEVNERRTRYDYGFMILRQPSVLINGSKKQILIRGKVGAQSSFDVGWYNTRDDETVSSTTTTNTLSVEANAPFSINSNDWPNQTCQSLNTGVFAVASTSSAINNFANFPDLEAELGLDDQTRVYKVYNKSSSQQVHFEVPSERSILRYAFPETVVFNDRSFSGKLLKNRTFWTIRLRGRVTICPASFSVRLTDQDQPDVDVFQYDIAITNEDCTFAIEFQLPSGGDTNLIDKQFVVRLTDSRKTMKLILVSPRGMPDFTIPEIDDEFDPKRLEILIPFAGAACGMVLLLIAILVYGYKTRPRDKYHRDRDNDLHFRHILYVVWFVGMRLVKSFLLTFTVFAVILTAIHYTNVTTLQGYEAFHDQQTKVEDDFVKLMDAHKVQEINRQWLILGEGKIVCDRKLKELNAFLEQYFREMRERQEEEMRRKSILRAAEHRIKKQFNATRAKFEAERKRLNKRMEEYAEEINSRVSQIRGKIEGSFWLKAAKALYKFLDWLASIFGSGIGKPFIRWVGLDVDFPSIDIGLSSFDDIFDGFQNSQLFREGNSSSNESLFKNLLNRDYKVNFSDISAPELNFSSPLSKEKAEELLALEWIAQLYRSGVISTILVLLDILWFVYRHSRTYQLAIVLIHGYPKIYQLEKIQKAEEKEGKKKKKKEEKLRKKKAEKEREQGETPEINDSGDELTDEERGHEISDEKIQKAEDMEGKKKKKMEEKMRKKMAGKNREQDKTPEINNSGEELTDEERDEISDEVDSSLNAKNKRTKMRNGKRSKEEDSRSVEKDTSSVKCEGEKDEGKGCHETDVENDSIENKGPKEAKKEKVISHGLKGLDRLNTAFLKFFVKLKEINYQINNTNLVPMCVLSVIGILSVYVVIVTAKHSMNVDTLDVVGFYDLKMAPLLTMRKIVNTRITSNAFMVNDVHIPYYENRVNARIAFYRKKAKMYQAYQCAKADLHNEEYCSWASEPGESCDGVGRYNEDFLSNLTQFECNLDPVIPQRFTKFDRIRYKEVYKKATSPYVSALRGLILDTFYMILIVIGIFIILKILGIAVFVLMKKFDLVRQVKHYQTSQDLVKEAAVAPDCIKYPPRESIKHIGPVAVSQEIREKCGPLAREGYHTEWVK